MILPMVAFTALSVVGVVIGSAAPRPDAPAADVLAYTREHAASMRLGAFLALASAVPLAIVAAIAYRRLRALGITAPGGAIALVGGTVAAVCTALSGLIGWAGSRVGDDAEVAAVLRDLVFVVGGVGFVPFLGLLIAGIAVPMLVLDINRPVAIAGVVLAVVAEASTLTTLTMATAFTLPVGRFGGIVWLLAVSLLLPATRPRRAEPVAGTSATAG